MIDAAADFRVMFSCERSSVYQAIRDLDAGQEVKEQLRENAIASYSPHDEHEPDEGSFSFHAQSVQGLTRILELARQVHAYHLTLAVFVKTETFESTASIRDDKSGVYGQVRFTKPALPVIEQQLDGIRQSVEMIRNMARQSA